MKHVFSILFILFYQLTIAQWKYAGYPNGGNVLSMTEKQGTLFANVGQDVFISVDKGESWTYSGNGLPKSDSIFLCASDNKVFAATRKGLYSSSNNGVTWNASAGLPDSVNNKVSYIAAKGKIILAGGPYGRIYRSDDEGLTWKLVYSESFFGIINSIVIKNDLVLAGIFNGLVYSRDLGLTWTIANNLPAIQSFFTFYKTKIIAEFWEDIYVSTDSGSTWNYLTNDLPVQTHGSSMSSDDSILYLGTTMGLFISVDEGETWVEAQSGLPYRSCANTLVSSGGMWMGTSKGIFYSTDHGNNWMEKNKGLQRIKTNALITNGNRVLSGCGSGMMVSDNNNFKWDYKLFGLTGNESVFYFTTLDTLIFAATGKDIFVSTDKGEYWNEVYKGMTLSDSYTTQVKANAGILYAPRMTDGIYRSTDRGENWEWINGDLPANAPITKVGFHNTILFIAVTNQGVYKSVNGGINWSQSTTGLPAALVINDIQTIGNSVFLVTDKGMYKSNDDGLNWTNVADIPVLPIHCITPVDKYILAGSEGEIFLSADQGISWRPVGNGFTSASVNAFALNGNIVYAATDWGVWYSNLNEVGIKENANELNVQIYPNPSQGVFRIRSPYVELYTEVYNSIGEKIMAATFNASSSQLDLSDQPQGMYVVKIYTSDQRMTIKKVFIQ